MVLEGAEILFYPTAIGSEPQDLYRRHPSAMAARHAGSRRGQRRADRGGKSHRARGQ